MPSPAELLEAAKPGEPFSEKEIAKIHNNYAKRFDCGFKGTHKLPEDYATREARKVHTPPHWRRVGIEETPQGFRTVSLISRVEFTPTDYRLLGLSETLGVATNSIDTAKEIGGIVEDACQRLLPQREQRNASSRHRVKKNVSLRTALH